ncbi:hypothetical protein [Streptomyces sp. R08]|uniref:Uncharacterized protein n=1 Tax=Streptomyces sp. R08 TaxID=3238624 RepID=A0AB39MIA5_9ACTN
MIDLIDVYTRSGVPRLVRRQEVPVMVDFHGWALQDWDDTQVPVTFPGNFQRNSFLSTHPGRLDFSSAGHTHTACLTIEVWDAQPPAPPGDWEEEAEAEIFTSSGKLRAWAVAGGPMPDKIDLVGGPSTWGVRVMCTGRNEVAEQSMRGLADGVEQYTAQFWPQK